MHHINWLIFSTMLFSLGISEPIWANPAMVGITDTEVENYVTFLSKSKKAPKDISSFNSPLLNRSLVSLILLQKAARIGGFTKPILVEGAPNSSRNLNLTKSGKFLAIGYDIWKEAAENYSENLYISDPIIDEGQFEKGIYGLKSNSNLFAINSLKDLQECCSILENPSWVVDHKTISEMKIKKVADSFTHESMMKMIDAGRADFVLFEFGQGQNMSLHQYGVTLEAVPGYKVAMRSSRHFVVSKKHPDGKEFFAALQRGIKILKQQNTFYDAFTEVGFFNSRTKEWKFIN